MFYIVLVDSWEQCKDADVILESPSAMAGVHIAEALRESDRALASIDFTTDFCVRYSILPNLHDALDEVGSIV